MGVIELSGQLSGGVSGGRWLAGAGGRHGAETDGYG